MKNYLQQLCNLLCYLPVHECFVVLNAPNSIAYLFLFTNQRVILLLALFFLLLTAESGLDISLL